LGWRGRGGGGACWWLYAPYLQTTVPTTVVPPTTVPPTSFVPPTLTGEQETQMLKQQMAALESQLNAIRKRLEELGK